MADKILVIGPSWIGDMVMAQSLFITLKRQNPFNLIDVLSPPWAAGVLERMPEVRSVIKLDVAHGKLQLDERLRIGKAMRKHVYQKAIVIPRSFKSALVPFFAKIPNRIGFFGEMRFGLLTDRRVLDKQVLTQTVQKTVALGLDSSVSLPPDTPYPKLTINTISQQKLMTEWQVSQDKPIVAMAPSAEYGKAKQWPLENFIKIAKHYINMGVQVLVFGSAKDELLGDVIAKAGAKNLCGKTSLTDAVDLLAVCERLITNDSGLMHIGAAVGTRVIAIYGSSSPRYTPPLTDNKQIHYLNLSCSPCFDKVCKFGTYDCLKQISTEQIV